MIVLFTDADSSRVLASWDVSIAWSGGGGVALVVGSVVVSVALLVGAGSVLFVQDIPLMVNTKSPSDKTEFAKYPSGSIA